MDPIPREALASLTPHQIRTMREQGLLDHLLRPGATTAPATTEAGTEAPTTGHTVADLAGMSAQQIVHKLRAGELDHLLRGEHPEPDPEPKPETAWRIGRVPPEDLTR